MKVISILQPWASLIVLGHKRIETRSWNTKYRGQILIHASAGKKKACRDLCTDLFLPFRDFIEDYDKLPFGAIIGQAWLKDTHRVETFTGLSELTKQERAFGDYSEGRYGWELTEATQFPIIIPTKGTLGIWEYKMPDKIGCYLADGAHASFDGMPDQKTVEAVEAMIDAAKKIKFNVY